MAFSLDDIVLGIRVDLAGLRSGLNTAKGEIQGSTASWGKKMGQYGRGMQSIGNEARMAGTGAVIAIAPIVGVLTAGVKGASEWGGKLQTLKTIGRGTDEQMKHTKKSIMDLSNTWGTSVNDITDAAIEFAAVGYSMEESVLLVRDATVLSRGGLGTMEEATTLLVQVMKQFHVSAKDAIPIIDSMAYVANETSANVGDLTTSMGYAGTGAAGMHIPFAEAAAIIGVVDNQLQDASMSGTSFRQVMNHLKNPTSSAAGIIKTLGVNFYDAQGQMKPFLDIVDEVNNSLQVGNKINITTTETNKTLVAGKAKLKAEMEDLRHTIATTDKGDPGLKDLKVQLEETRHEYNLMSQLATRVVKPGLLTVDEAFKNQALSVLFGVRGQNMYNAIVSAGTDEVRKLTEGANKQGYATQVATDITKGASYQFDILKESLRNTAIAIGGDLIPMLLDFAREIRANLPAIRETAKAFTGGFIVALKTFAEVVITVVKAIHKFPKPLADAIMGIGGVLTVVLAIVGPLLIFTGMMISAAGSVAVVVGMIAESSAIMGALGVIVATLTAPITLVIGAIVLLALAWRNNWFDIQGKTAAALEYLSGLWNEFINGLAGMWTNVKGAVLGVFNSIVNGLKNFVEDNHQLLNILAGLILTMATGGGWLLWKHNIFGIKDAVIGAYNAIVEVFTKRLPEMIKHGEEIVHNFIQGISEKLKEVKAIGRKLLQQFLDGLQEIYDQYVKPFFEEINTLITKALDFLRPAYTWGKNLLNSFIDGIKSSYDNLKESVKGAADIVEDFIGLYSPARKGPLSNLMKWGPNLTRSFADGLLSGKGTIEKAMKDITSNLTPDDVRLKPKIKVDLSTVVDELKRVAEEIANMAQELIVVDELGLEQDMKTPQTVKPIASILPPQIISPILTPSIVPKTPLQTFTEAINTTNINDSSSRINNMFSADHRQANNHTTHVNHNSIVVQVKEAVSKEGVDKLINEINERIVKTTRNTERLGV